MKLQHIADFCSNLSSSVASVMKTLILSGKPSPQDKEKKTRALTIMGNGPSLKTALQDTPQLFTDNDLMAVNFSPNTPEFFELKPSMLVLADSHFFTLPTADSNVERLWKNISDINWPILLWVPANHRKAVKQLTAANKNIEIRTFNLTPIEGFRRFRELMFDLGAGMPRPRNVLIPSIMIGLRMQYNKIYLTGADHSWSQTLWVDNQNRVVSIQPHYYKDNSKELDRVASEYAGYHLHDIYTSLAIAFRSYHIIAPYAMRKGCEIINASDGSFIDAFPRMQNIAKNQGF